MHTESNQNIIEKGYSFLVIAIAIVALFSAYPYIFNQLLPIPSLSIITFGLIGCLLIINLLWKPNLKLFSNGISIIIFIQILCWALYIILHRDISYVNRIFFLILSLLILLSLKNSEFGLFNFTKCYNKFIVIMSIFGVIAFFLIYFNFIHPILTFPNKDGRQALFYGITSTNSIFGNAIRYAGYFDEPGAMAYWGIWALIFNKLFFHNKRNENILLFCLCFTFSMAYYIQMILYLILFKVKKISSIIISTTLLLMGIGYIYSMQYDNPLLYKMTLGRFEVDTEGNVKGDNRSELMYNAKLQFISSPIFGIGSSNSSQTAKQEGGISDNPFETLAVDGIIGTIITYLPLIYVMIKKRNKDYLFSSIILFIGFLQRPFHHYILYYFMLYSLVILALNQHKAHHNIYRISKCNGY